MTHGTNLQLYDFKLEYTFQDKGNTVVKILPMDTSAQDYTFIFIKSGDTLDASVFLGGDNASGIMVIKDENGEECFLRISEFHLLSLRENPNPRKEVGLMTSFLWLTAKVYTSIIYFSQNGCKKSGNEPRILPQTPPVR